MSEIPEDLIADVLSRQPVKALLRFRCVSKQWCALIDSPNFINLQLNQSLKINTIQSVISQYHAVHDLFSLGFDSLKLEYPFLKSEEYYEIVGSCNGFICLRGFNSNITNTGPVLLNPSTKQHQILPPVPPPGYHQVYRFGYDPVHDDYNIVRFARLYFDYGPLGPAICVYSFRSNIWRRINHRLPLLLENSYSVVLFNGVLHWLATRQPKSTVANFIAAFDLVVDNYWEVQLPNRSDYKAVTLGVAGGCLWLGCSNDDSIIELWVMKDYMVHESWTKHSLAFCAHLYKPLLCRSPMRILAYSESSSEVLIQINIKHLWLDLKHQTVVDHWRRSPGSEIFTASLVKLPCEQGKPTFCS